MVENHDQHAHRNLEGVEAPFDEANQSLADALRASFSVLKGIMLVLVILYLASNVRGLESHQEALVLRLGTLQRVVDQPGLVWAFPYPIDEIVPLPTRKSNTMLIDSHTFFRSADEVGKPLAFIQRGFARGLNPVLDGALLTADQGLVHVRWRITYKIDHVGAYVREIAGNQVEAAEALIRTFVETVGIEVASRLTAEEIIRTRIEFVQDEMRSRVNARLAALGSGVTVTHVEMYEYTPPIPVRQAFDATQRAENTRQQQIQAARKERTRILSEAAGEAHEDLVAILDGMDRVGTDAKSAEALRVELDDVLENRVAGEAGRRLRDAGAYLRVAVSQMESDLEQYRTLLPEYKRNPTMLLNRLWEETKQQIFASPGVIKFYYPEGLGEFRLKIPLDPEQSRFQEEQRLRKQGPDVSKLRSERLVPVGPEYD